MKAVPLRSESDAAARMRRHRVGKEEDSVTMLRKNEHCYREIDIDKEKDKDIDIELEIDKEDRKKGKLAHTQTK